jgi:hypothetical protein
MDNIGPSVLAASLSAEFALSHIEAAALWTL